MRFMAKPARLRVEALESRCMLAGNVAAKVFGDLLFIRGDAASNEIALTTAANQQITVTGMGTSVNGTATAQTFNNVRAVHVLLHNGDDTLSFDNGATSNLRTLLIDGGRGSETVTLTNIRTGTLVVNTLLGGGDEVALNSVDARHGAVINTGSGNDTLLIDGLTSTSFVVNSGNGDDTLRMGSVGPVGVNVKFASLFTLRGNDTVELTNSTIARNLIFDLGAGDDSFTATDVNTSARGTLLLALGSRGNDTLAGLGTLNFKHRLHYGFETET